MNTSIWKVELEEDGERRLLLATALEHEARYVFDRLWEKGGSGLLLLFSDLDLVMEVPLHGGVGA